MSAVGITITRTSESEVNKVLLLERDALADRVAALESDIAKRTQTLFHWQDAYYAEVNRSNALRESNQRMIEFLDGLSKELLAHFGASNWKDVVTMTLPLTRQG